MTTKKTTTKKASKKTTTAKDAVASIDKNLERIDAAEAKPKRTSKAPAKKKASTRAATAGRAAKGKAKAATGATKPKAATRAKRPAKDAKPRKVSLMDAAVMILGKAKEPMSAQAIVDAVAEQGLWKGEGKTPHATLYAAMIREIAKKGKASRFTKVERGRFALAGKGA